MSAGRSTCGAVRPVGELTVFVLLSFVVYRATRFVIEDGLIVEPRMWLLRKILPDKNDSMWRSKLHYLIRCPYCLGIWFSAAAVVILCQFQSVPLPWLMGGAVSGGAMAVWRYVEQN